VDGKKKRKKENENKRKRKNLALLEAAIENKISRPWG
jgi:hypothetical protein